MRNVRAGRKGTKGRTKNSFRKWK